jgi:hypothetical protein
MTNTEPTASVGRRDHALALADALLESNRRLQPLPAAAHDRVKRRLRIRLGSPAFRRARWLRPLVVAGSLLFWGTAFGIAIDHFVIERHLRPGPQLQPVSTHDKLRARRPRAKPERPIAVENVQAAPSEPAVPQKVAAPPVEPLAPARSVTTLSPLLASARPRNSRSQAPFKPPLRSPVAFVDPAALSPHASAGLAGRESLPATGPTVPAALPAPSPEVRAPAPAATALVAPPAPLQPPEKTIAAAEDMSEERLLASAVRALRAKQDAASALVALDAYRACYPQGRLFVEASVLRVDALTALHRQPEALRFLDELDLSRMPGGLERRLQRGELRAASGRFREALADFDEVLSHAREQDLLQRALGGRAQCRQRLGDLAGARSDASEYLRRFPAGPFARQAGDIAKVGP